MHSWSMLGARTATRTVSMDVVASYKELDKPVITDKPTNSPYFKDAIAIEVGSDSLEGQPQAVT